MKNPYLIKFKTASDVFGFMQLNPHFKNVMNNDIMREHYASFSDRKFGEQTSESEKHTYFIGLANFIYNAHWTLLSEDEVGNLNVFAHIDREAKPVLKYRDFPDHSEETFLYTAIAVE